tara:strand:+ start:531 stop:1109 length:579 start_codon:yes stop_codon:yes gene_type:complete
MIIVTSLKDHANVCKSLNASHLISVIDPGFAPDTPYNVKHHLRLGFDDITEINSKNFIHRKSSFVQTKNIDEQVLPNEKHIIEIINFVLKWDKASPIVIHCWCGVSRSMATAIYILCKYYPNDIDRNIRYIRSIAPHANPNKLMISLFEKHLGLNGLINKSLKKYPSTITYDCEINFAPITIFKLEELKKFK